MWFSSGDTFDCTAISKNKVINKFSNYDSDIFLIPFVIMLLVLFSYMCKILGAQHSFKRRSQKIRLTSVRDIGDKAPFDKAPLASSPVCLWLTEKVKTRLKVQCVTCKSYELGAPKIIKGQPIWRALNQKMVNL
jgi:hypothetical protein